MTYVLFTVDGTEIRPAYHDVMEMVYQVMREHPDLRLEIHGHTDSTGSSEYNAGLTRRSAQSAEDYLVEKGISADRIITGGHGEDDPRTSNQTEGGRSGNRRVTFKPVFN
ncbi:MAG: OmpA family protein [Bacteroidales bacterium]